MDPIFVQPPAKNIGLLAIGEALVDIITTEFVEDLSQAHILRLFPGGSPANLCRFVQKCGGKATLIAAVGTDGLGKILLQAFAKTGLSTRYIQQLEEHATSIILLARSKHTPDFIPYRVADKYVTFTDDSLLSQVSVIHTTAFALSKSPAQENILNAFEMAYQKGITVSVDWNYAEPIWGKMNNARQVFNRVLSYAPLLKVSMDDIERYTGKTLVVETAKEYLQALPASVICLTCGAQGVWFKTPETNWQHVSAQPVEVVDATGAGDAFWAGFLTYWMAKQPLLFCVENGIATAGKRLQGLI